MHGDEAVHAIKFGDLLQDGVYTYDPHEYHGPVLNYFSLLPAWLTGAESLIEVNESHLRVVPVFFGVLLILLLLPLAKSLGWPIVLTAVVFTAVSPTLIFYSRYYIQETLLVCTAFGLLVSGFRYFQSGKLLWIVAGGIFLGLMHATKETFVISIAAMTAAFGVVAFLVKRETSGSAFEKHRGFAGRLLIGLGTAALVSMLFFSSFLSHPQGVLDSVLTYQTYFDRAGENAFHIQPWHYYLKILLHFQIADAPVFTEAFFMVLAVIGAIFSFKKSAAVGVEKLFFRLITIYTGALFSIFSAIPYKTPWNMLGFYHAMLILAAFGAVSVWRFLSERAKRQKSFATKIAATSFVIAFLIGFGHIGWQAYYWNFKADASPANPHVYAHPTDDVFAITETIKNFAKASDQGTSLHIEFACKNDDYWPFPWYLRELPNIGWRNKIDFEAPSAPIMIISPELEGDLVTKLYEKTPPGQRDLYAPLFDEYMELRPGLEIRGYVKVDLWNKYHSTEDVR